MLVGGPIRTHSVTRRHRHACSLHIAMVMRRLLVLELVLLMLVESMLLLHLLEPRLGLLVEAMHLLLVFETMLLLLLSWIDHLLCLLRLAVARGLLIKTGPSS